MDDTLGREHEEEVLKAFDRVASDFRSAAEGSRADGSDMVSGGAAVFTSSETVKGRGRSAGRSRKPRAEKKEGASAKGSGRPSKPAKAGPKRKKVLRIALYVAAVLFVAGVIACAAAFYYAYDVAKEAPEINPDNLYELLSENSVVLDSQGEVLDNIYVGDSLRSNLEFSEMPQDLINAFVAIEDKTFWEHNGFNFIRIIGAIRDALLHGSKVSGTSTITQQLARNLYLPDKKLERSMNRKIVEAYYTIIIEKNLSKEQIIEAYLNTIALGFNSNGVQAAAQAYFSKDAKDLDLIECVCLATLPQKPGAYAPIKRVETASVEDPDSLDIISRDEDYIIYYNDACLSRMKLVLRFMHEQGKISDEEYASIDPASIRDHINPGTDIYSSGVSSYFTDYVVKQVKQDLMRELGMDEGEAENLIYNGGLYINTTMDRRVQQILEEEYAKPANFPSVGSYRKDAAGNIVGDSGKLLLYNKSNMFDGNGNFVLAKDEYAWNPNGDLTVFAGKRLNIYRTSVAGSTDYSVEFKPMYELVDKVLYSIDGVWNIAAAYKDRDDKGNLILKAAYFTEAPEAFKEQADGTILLSPDYFRLKSPVVQPQSAMVIMDNATGAILGMVGGRNIEGKLLFNRATSPRQPGSAIKPISVYATALQAGVDGRAAFTAATPLDDRPIVLGGKPWPKNWYTGYRGMTNLRNAVEQSINCCAVQLYMQMDPAWCVEALQNMGVSSLVTTGEINDINASALALGGMSRGISPLEMCAAYATFGNYGTYQEPSCYTTVTNKKGDVILRSVSITHKVMEESVSSLMTDILRTTVTNGLGSGAKLASQPSAGKTGTTSDRYDVWFCGLTPQVCAATWIGNDVNISMDQGSGAAAKLWSSVMNRVGGLYERGNFEMRGEFVTATVDRYSGKLMTDLSSMDSRNAAISEIFIKGTVPEEHDDSHVMVHVCAQTGYLATPACPHTVNKLAIVRPGGSSWEKLLVEYGIKSIGVGSLPDAVYDAPEYYCPVHNPSPGVYPISPLYSGTSPYTGSIGQEEPVVPEDPGDGTEPQDIGESQDGYIPGITDPDMLDPSAGNGGDGTEAPTEPQAPSDGQTPDPGNPETPPENGGDGTGGLVPDGGGNWGG